MIFHAAAVATILAVYVPVMMAHAQCLDALLKTVMSPRVPLPLRVPASAGLLDGFFVHAAALADEAWSQLTELLDFLLLKCAPPTSDNLPALQNTVPMESSKMPLARDMHA